LLIFYLHFKDDSFDELNSKNYIDSKVNFALVYNKQWRTDTRETTLSCKKKREFSSIRITGHFRTLGNFRFEI